MVVVNEIYSATAVELLFLWLYGDGSDQYFGNNSSLADDFRASPKMNAIIDDAIEIYKRTGQTFFYDTATITGFQEFDLWMGVRGFTYEISIEEETYSTGFWIWKKTYTQYNIEVVIQDIYNFNSGTDSGDGLGSILNNFAYDMHEKGYGKDYAWKLSYSQTKGRTRRFYLPIFIL